METLKIPCPKCNKILKLRDSSKLGKKAKCPACAHVFVLQAQNSNEDEVKFELAEVAAPAVGQAAQWVPDQPAATESVDFTSAPPTGPAPQINSEFANLGEDSETGAGVARLKELQRKKSKQRKLAIIVGSLTAVVVVGVFLLIRPHLNATAVNESKKPKPEIVQEWVDEKETLKANVEIAKAESPTSGQPIELTLVPAGARILINLHPSELWREGSAGEEFRFCLGEEFGTWLETKIKDLCRREPAEIEEVLICIILGARGSEPEVSAVVHLAEEAKKSELLQAFQGERVEDYGYPVYLSEGNAYLIKDTKTYAVCPEHLAEDIVLSMKYPSPTATGIEELLRKTDRDRHLTIVFQPQDTREHHEVLFTESLHSVANLFLDWFGDDVETVAWSLHLGDKFHSEIKLRNQALTTPARLQRTVRKNLNKLPNDLLTAVSKMNPTELGKRKIIGRFPAMMKVFALATAAGIDERHIQLTTGLPERAAPNLALASLLAWDESTRTDFTKSVESPKTKAKGPKLPDLIVDRLKLKIDIDFRRTPLQEAFDFIAEETKVRIEIDGDALKLSGYTKNMAQTFKKKQKPATESLAEILKKYPAMCLILDEKKKVLTVMTRPVAKDRGLKIYEIKP